MPISASTGVNDVGLSRRTKTLSLDIPPRLSSQEVIVVPTFAPMITFMPWRSVIIPEFTKPTTITVVADELCITAVKPSPVRNPVMTLPVIFSSSVRSLLPARRSSDCPMTFMPKRKRQSPPSKESRLKISMFPIPSFSIHNRKKRQINYTKEGAGLQDFSM